ncbi:MAG TPA: hypothetical protein G4O15_08490 [Dehalococcoidia bacterium]|nr:hypothetical protein [Dehalococcoidia bacterium]
MSVSVREQIHAGVYPGVYGSSFDKLRTNGETGNSQDSVHPRIRYGASSEPVEG